MLWLGYTHTRTAEDVLLTLSDLFLGVQGWVSWSWIDEFAVVRAG